MSSAIRGAGGVVFTLLAGYANAPDPEAAPSRNEAVRIVRDGGEIPPDGACELFSTLAELQGEPPGRSRVVTYFPNSKRPVSISA